MSRIGDGIISIVETILNFTAAGSHRNMENYCDLETADNRTTLVMRDGSLVSIIKLDGTKRLVGADEYISICEKLTNGFSSYMGSGGHAVQVYFERDPDAVGREIDTMMHASVETAKRLNLNVSDVIDDRKSVLGSWCAREVSYVAFFTTPEALGKDAILRARLTQKEANAKVKAPFVDAQNPIIAVGELRDRHASFVAASCADMRDAGLLIRPLDIHEAVRTIRMTIDPGFTSDDWKPYLPGDPLPTRISRRDKSGRDISDLLWPRLSLQLFPRDIHIEGSDYITVGERTYSPIFINLPQREITPFSVLFSRIAEYNIPWRVSFLIESGGLKAVSIKHMVTSLLAFAHNDNKLINEAYEELKAGVERKGQVDAKLRISLATWAPSDNIKLVKQRSSQLARAVEGWGSCDVGEASGDPPASFVSSSLCVSSGSIATAAAAELSEVIQQLPITRPASPWQDGGSILFRTPDGKIMPYQPGSSKQDMWIDLIFATPGSGKSVLLNATNFALCLSPGLQRLPRIFIIDIGPSSKGLVSLLSEALPENQKHLVMYARLRMTPEYSINPFDTQLGCRFPMPLERAFLVNFLTLLATPVGRQDPFDGIADMAGLVVDEMYTMYSDASMAKPYSPNIDTNVDLAVAEAGLKVDRKTTWWEVVDALFKAGKTHAASQAQRYAVPLVPDAVSACNAEPIRQMFSKIVTPSGEPLVDSFGRMISGAVREYPILSSPTVFDIGEARVISLDLDEVAKTGGEAADRQTSVMYMLARYLARDFYLNAENLADMPPDYRAHHKKRITEIREDIKRICMDEFHRTSKSRSVREQVVVDMREGRKWGIHVVLLSQSIDDFDAVMAEFATNIFILSAGNAPTVDKVCGVFGLNATDRFALERRVHGPRAGGPTFLAMFRTKEGNNVQLLTNTAGAIEMWAFSTTVEDAMIRDRLYAELGPAKARSILAKVYKGGTAKPDVERRKASLKDTGSLDEKAEVGVIEQIVTELLAKSRAEG